MKIDNNLHYIGVSDPDLRTFDIIMKTANGTTYNSYLLKTDEGVVIFDTVKEEFFQNNADVSKPVWDLLSCMMLIEKKGKMAAAFGSYGWSTEAMDMVQSRLKSLKFRVPLDPKRIKLIPNKEKLCECFEYGIEFGEFAKGKTVEMTL